MENKIRIKYGSADLDRFHARLIADGHTGLFLPSSVLIDRVSITAVYDVKGYVPIKDLEIWPERLMKITAGLLEKMALAEHRYFQAGEYHIKKYLLFVDRATDDVKIIYEKSDEAGWERVKYEIADLISTYEIQSRTSGKGADASIYERMASIIKCSRSMEGCARIFRNICRKNEHAQIRADIEGIKAAGDYR
jgi:hypothetical protein